MEPQPQEGMDAQEHVQQQLQQQQAEPPQQEQQQEQQKQTVLSNGGHLAIDVPPPLAEGQESAMTPTMVPMPMMMMMPGTFPQQQEMPQTGPVMMMVPAEAAPTLSPTLSPTSDGTQLSPTVGAVAGTNGTMFKVQDGDHNRARLKKELWLILRLALGCNEDEEAIDALIKNAQGKGEMETPDKSLITHPHVWGRWLLRAKLDSEKNGTRADDGKLTGTDGMVCREIICSCELLVDNPMPADMGPHNYSSGLNLGEKAAAMAQFASMVDSLRDPCHPRHYTRFRANALSMAAAGDVNKQGKPELLDMVLKHVTPLVKLKNQNKDLSVPATWCTRTDGGATAEGQPMAATYGSFRTNSGVNGEAQDSNAFASVASHGLQIGENQDSGRYWTNTLLGGCMSYVTPLASAVLSGQLANVKAIVERTDEYLSSGIRRNGPAAGEEAAAGGNSDPLDDYANELCTHGGFVFTPLSIMPASRVGGRSTPEAVVRLLQYYGAVMPSFISAMGTEEMYTTALTSVFARTLVLPFILRLDACLPAAAGMYGPALGEYAYLASSVLSPDLAAEFPWGQAATDPAAEGSDSTSVYENPAGDVDGMLLDGDGGGGAPPSVPPSAPLPKQGDTASSAVLDQAVEIEADTRASRLSRADLDRTSRPLSAPNMPENLRLGNASGRRPSARWESSSDADDASCNGGSDDEQGSEAEEPSPTQDAWNQLHGLAALLDAIAAQCMALPLDKALAGCTVPILSTALDVSHFCATISHVILATVRSKLKLQEKEKKEDEDTPPAEGGEPSNGDGPKKKPKKKEMVLVIKELEDPEGGAAKYDVRAQGATLLRLVNRIHQAWAVYGNWQRHTNDNSNSYRLFRDTEASVILSSCGRYEDQFKAVLDAGVTQTSPGTFVIFPNGAIGAVPLCNKLALLTDLFADGAVMECNPTRDDTEWFQARPQTVGGWEKDQLAFYPGQRLSALTSILTRFPRGSDYIRRTLSRMPIPLLQAIILAEDDSVAAREQRAAAIKKMDMYRMVERQLKLNGDSVSSLRLTLAVNLETVLDVQCNSDMVIDSESLAKADQVSIGLASDDESNPILQHPRFFKWKTKDYKNFVSAASDLAAKMSSPIAGILALKFALLSGKRSYVSRACRYIQDGHVYSPVLQAMLKELAQEQPSQAATLLCNVPFIYEDSITIRMPRERLGRGWEMWFTSDQAPPPALKPEDPFERTRMGSEKLNKESERRVNSWQNWVDWLASGFLHGDYALWAYTMLGPGCMLLAVVYVILWAISWGIVAAWSYCFKFMFKEARRGCRQAWITTAAYIRTMGELGQAFAKQPGGQLPEYRPIYTRHYNELRENVKKKLAEARRNTSKGAAAGAVLSVYSVPLQASTVGDIRSLENLVEGSGVHPSAFACPAVRAMVNYRWQIFTGKLLYFMLYDHLVYMGFFLAYALTLNAELTSKQACAACEDISACPLPNPTFPETCTVQWGDCIQLTPTRQGLLAMIFILTTSYIYQEVRQVKQNGLRELTRPWNVLDMASIFLVIVIFFNGVRGCSGYPDLQRNACAVEVIILFFRLLYFSMANPQMGAFVRMVIEVVKDLLYFFIFLGIIWLGFACAVLSFQPDGGAANYDSDVVTRFWTLIFGGYDGSDARQPKDGSYNSPVATSVLSRILAALFMVVVYIILLNLLIAIINETYDKIRQNEEVEAIRNKAIIILETESVVPEWLRKMRDRTFKLDSTGQSQWLHFMTADADDDDDEQEEECVNDQGFMVKGRFRYFDDFSSQNADAWRGRVREQRAFISKKSDQVMASVRQLREEMDTNMGYMLWVQEQIMERLDDDM